MLYTKNLLSRFISINEDVEIIARELTVKTCEVEEIHQRTIPDLVVIGKVLETKKHPDADKLTICQIDCGSKGTFQICTAAENVLPNIYVPVALPGCFLPAIDLQIEPRQMRGVDSNGMICSKNELGIDEDAGQHWIRILQHTTGGGSDFEDITDSDLGKPFGEKYPWLANRIIDVENKTITHRPDMFGHFGLAVESLAIFSDKIHFQTIVSHMEQIQTDRIGEVIPHSAKPQREIIVQSDNVLSYTLLEINDSTIQSSDFFTRLALYDSGLQPRMNRVDFSNLFMLLTGQPVHFFDAAKVDGDIIVRNAQAGERFVDLFGKEHTLIAEDLVIADRQKILALAGVIGSNSSGVDENTKNILVEIANFDAVTVRRTGTRLGLRTDAELRYEKYINPLYTMHCLLFMLDELQYNKKNLGEFTIGGATIWSHADLESKLTRKVQVSPDVLVAQIHGEHYTEKEDFLAQAKRLLTHIGCTVSDDWTVTIPGWRSPDDLTIEADIVEEVARLYGFDRIGQLPYANESEFVPLHPVIAQQRELEERLSRRHHFDQIETYPWIHARRLDQYTATDHLYTMQNPLTPEQLYLRDTMLRNFLEAVEKNGPVFDHLRLFDIGKTWDKKRSDSHEHSTLCLAIRNKTVDSLQENGLLLIKSILQTLLPQSTIEYQPSTASRFHPKQQAAIVVNGKTIGYLGTIHPATLQSCKLPETGQLVIAQLDLTAVQTNSPAVPENVTYETLQDQLIRRDLSFIVDHAASYGSVRDALLSVEQIQDVEVFDVYQGERIPAGKKSISLSFKIVGDGSLTTESINQIMQTAIDRVQATGALLRQ